MNTKLKHSLYKVVNKNNPLYGCIGFLEDKYGDVGSMIISDHGTPNSKLSFNCDISDMEEIDVSHVGYSVYFDTFTTLPFISNLQIDHYIYPYTVLRKACAIITEHIHEDLSVLDDMQPHELDVINKYIFSGSLDIKATHVILFIGHKYGLLLYIDMIEFKRSFDASMVIINSLIDRFDVCGDVCDIIHPSPYNKHIKDISVVVHIEDGVSDALFVHYGDLDFMLELLGSSSSGTWIAHQYTLIDMGLGEHAGDLLNREFSGIKVLNNLDQLLAFVCE